MKYNCKENVFLIKNEKNTSLKTNCLYNKKLFAGSYSLNLVNEGKRKGDERMYNTQFVSLKGKENTLIE